MVFIFKVIHFELLRWIAEKKILDLWIKSNFLALLFVLILIYVLSCYLVGLFVETLSRHNLDGIEHYHGYRCYKSFWSASTPTYWLYWLSQVKQNVQIKYFSNQVHREISTKLSMMLSSL